MSQNVAFGKQRLQLVRFSSGIRMAAIRIVVGVLNAQCPYVTPNESLRVAFRQLYNIVHQICQHGLIHASRLSVFGGTSSKKLRAKSYSRACFGRW